MHLSLILTACLALPGAEPTALYSVKQIEGWRVLISAELMKKEHESLRGDVLKLLESQLYQITRVVPTEALAKLRKVTIWVERAHPRHPCMCYHVSPEWLKQHGMNADKARGVEIASCKNFLSWTRDQPWMVLHELAHAYHDQVLGFDHAKIKACFDRAVSSKSYEQVQHVSGKKVKHYALSNPREYFAEATEAFFGTNDFYPFVRAELKSHDPGMFELLEKLWGVKK
jgi:hypothetical protein